MRISIDPGVNCTGVAWWAGRGTVLLGACGFRRSANVSKEEFANMIATAVASTARQTNKEGELQIIIEFPQAYHERAQQKGDQNDLLHLAYFVGLLHADLIQQELPPFSVFLPLPRQWKGQLDKDVSLLRITKKLSAEEVAQVELPSAKSLHHNVWDAVGIGLWKTKRALCR